MKKTLALVLALAMCFSLVACGGGDSKPSDSSKPAQSQGAATSAQPATPPAAEVEYEEWLYIEGGIDSVDPHNRTGSFSEQLTCTTFDTVTYLNTDTGEVMPELAYKWEPNADNTEWTFYLEEGVTFHNGNKFTADDVKFTWEFAGSGKGNVLKPIASLDYVEEIVVVNDYTIKFILKSGMPDFASYLETKIYDKESFDELGQEKAGVIGTGPYYYDEAETIWGQKVVVTRYENYWRGTENYATKHLAWVEVGDDNAISNALQTGQIDIWSRPLTSMYNTLSANEDLTAHVRGGAMIYHMAYNYRNPVMQDLTVRKALAQAINKEDIEMIFWEGGIGGFAHDNYCPPSGLGYSDNIDTIPYDPDAARAVLEPMGLKLTLACYEANQRLCEIIQDCLEDVGVEIELNVLPASNWDAFKREGTGYDIYAEYGSYQGALLYNFNRFFARDAASNPYKYDSQEFEDKLAYVREATSYDEMLKRFEELQQFVADDIASFPLGVSNIIVFTQNDVEGIQLAPTINWHDYSMARAPKRS